MKKYIFLMVALLSAVGMKAQQQIGDFWYYLNEGDLTASLDVNNPSVTYDDEITISSTVEYDNKEYTVNAISQWYYPNKRVSLVLPSTITNVSLSCFQSEIGTLTLPANATVDVNGSNNVEAFALSGDNANYSVEDGVLFDKDQKTLIAYPRLKDRTSYTVPSTVTAIGNNAFNNTNIEYLTLPEGLLYIGAYSMRGMSHLNSCNLPSTLKTIGEYAFEGCRLVFEDNTLTLPKTLTSIGQYALYNAIKYAGSTTVLLPRELGSDVDGGTNLYINERAIQCNSIKSEILKPISVHWNAFSEVQVIFIPDGTKELYLQKDGWNYDNGSKLRGGGVSYDETVANVVITDVLDYDNRTVSATLTTETEDAVIRYKIVRSDQGDNSDPTQWDIYDGGTISMVSNSWEYSNYSYTLKAIAFKDEMNSSAIASKIYKYSDYVCSRPTITCADNSTTLTISTSDENATIYYTTDGSTPTATESETCFKYTGTITLTSNATYKAITAKENAFASEVAERSVTWFPVEPVQAEQILVDGQPCLKLTTATEGAEIWYSFNWHYEDYRYDKPIPAGRNQRIYFMAKKQGLNSTGWNDYTMNYDDYTQCESPSVQLNNETRQITLSTTEEGADIWYLIDRDNNPNNYPMPNANGSTKYDGNPFRPWTNGRLKVISAKDGMVNSSICETGLDEVFRLRNVDFEPILGEEENEFKLGFSYPETGINGVKIYYYYSGIDWTEYAGTPVNVPANTYVYAQARAEGYADSYQRDFYVSNDRYVVSQPNITTISQDHKLRITCDTKGVTIYYTTDGTDPTTDSPNHFEISEYYTPDVEVPQNGTYKFMAVKAGMNNSPIASITISDWYRVPRVNIIPFAKDGKMMVKLTCKDEGNYKYYWAYSGNVNYDVITANSEYAMSQDMEIESNREVYFTAYKDGYQANWVSKWIYNSDYTCSTPSITVNADTIVNMNTNTVGAKIKYTLDDSDPSTSWTAKEYSEPFKIDRNYTIKSVAIKDSLFNSNIQTNNYNSFRVADIAFEQVLEDGQPKMKITTTTEGATILYTFNRYNRDNSAQYSGPVAMRSGQYIFATAVKEGYNDASWQEKYFDTSEYEDRCSQPNLESSDEMRQLRLVTLTTEEEGGEIYYVIDTEGNKYPTKNDTKYDGQPFKPSVYGTLKAVVFKEDKVCSDIAEFDIGWAFRLRDVTFEPQIEHKAAEEPEEGEEGGEELKEGEDEYQYKMHFSYRDTTVANNNDIEIYYWYSGEEQKKYDGTPIDVELGKRIYAKVKKPGYIDSDEKSMNLSTDSYTLRQPQVYRNRDEHKLTVTWDDEDATVAFTNDGTDPATSTTATKYTKWWHPDIVVDQNRTYKFIAMKDKMLNSPVNTVEITDWIYVPEVAIKIFGKEDKLMAKIDCPDAWNYKFYWAYSDNISRDNVTANNEYKGEFEVIDGKYLNATAYKDGYLVRWVSSGWINRNNYMCSQPSIMVNEEKSVTINSNTAGATIKYTLDDSDPETSSTALVYTEPFTINRNYTIKAVAMKDSLLTSNIASNNYSSFRVADIAFEQVLEDGQPKMKITTATEGATILYTFNRYNRDNSAQYSGPVAMRSGQYIFATAVKEGYNDAGWQEKYFDTSEYEDRCSQPNLESSDEMRQLRLVALTTEEEGGEIYYVIDTEGNKYPTKNDTKYDGQPFKPSVYGTLKAVVFKEDKVCSDIAEFNIDWAFRLRDVTFEPQIEHKAAEEPEEGEEAAEEPEEGEEGGEELKEGEDEYQYKMHFSYRDTTVANNNDIEIYYWYSGEEQKKYDGTPIDVELGKRIYAKAKKSGYIDSDERYMNLSTDSYTLRQPQVYRNRDEHKLTVTWDDEDATVYYTDDGTEPTSSSNELDKRHPDIVVDQNRTYKFIAMKDKMLNSPVNTVEITDWIYVPEVAIKIFGKEGKLMAKIDCPNAGNYKFYWAYDNNISRDNVTANNEYKYVDFEVTEGRYIYATAYKDGYLERWVSSNWIYRSNYTCSQPSIMVNEEKLVTISSNTAGATIKYTLDNSDPETSSNALVYTEPFTINRNYTIKAVAMKDSLLTSNIASNNYSSFSVADIAFEQVLEDGQPKMKLTTATEGATILYSFNGYDRNNSIKYSGPVAMRSGRWIYATAVKDGYNDAGWREQYFDTSEYEDRCSQPNLDGNNDKRLITLTTEEEGGEIYYVIDTDGTKNPTKNDIKYDGNPFKPSVYGTLKAVVFKEDKVCSDIAEFDIGWAFRLRDVTFEPQIEPKAADELKEGEDAYRYKMHFSYRDTTVANNGDIEIYYWYSGEEQKKYDGTPIDIELGSYIYAKVKKPGYIDSWDREMYINQDSYMLHQPNVNARSESKKLIVTWDDEDAKVYWTDNGEDPTATNGKSLDKYYHPDIELTHNGTYKFIAMKDKMLNSPITTVTINDWFRVPQVKIVPYGDNDKFMAKLECEGYNNIYWAYEDEVVTDAVVGNNPYTGPIEVIEGKRIYATAWKEGYNENWTSSDWLYKNNYTCTVPTIAINRDTIVTITNNQTGSKIRYTLDGSDPTIYTGNEYKEPFKLLNNATIKAIAYKDSLLTSSVRSQQYSGYRVAGVTISTYIENNQIMAKLETKTPDAKIYYNFNERNNVVTGNLLYSVPFVVADGYRVQANAVKDGYTDAGWTSTDWLNYASYTATQPIITIMPDTTVFMSADTGAEIRYTLDGTTPTANSSKYTTTIKLTRNSQIRAIAIETGKINSAVTENNYNGFRVQDVNFSFFAQGNSLMAELSCENKDATIYYKIGDGYNAQDITASPNVKYTAPFAVSENRRIWASAAKDGYNNANWKYVEGVTKAAYTATMPDIGTDESGKVSITGEKDATFYYTTNNTTPTTNSTLYKEPFAVNQNDTIKAIAVVDRKFNSSVTTYYYTAYRVNPVTIKPVVLDNVLKMELSTTTPDATIYYGINSHNARASANVRYTAPFAVRDGDVVYASAAKNGYQDAVWIELDNISVKDYTCSQPQIAVDADGVVSIASDAGATIYYTLNEATPTVASTKYTGSFQLTRNATIKAFATMNGMINSAVTQYVHDRFRVEAPVFAQEGIMMTITTTTPDATIYYSYESEGNTLNTNSHKYTEPFPVMDNSMLRAYAVREGWFDSDINTINTGDKIACPMVEAVSYDGHFLTLKTIEDATIWYTTNGNDPRDNSNNTVNWIYEYKTPIAINSTGEIKAIATKNYMNPSEIATFDINFYAGENGTKLEKSGVLEEVMAWSDPSTITEFDIEGPLNQADLAFIKNSMTALQHLDMSKTTIEDGVLPDNAFSGLPIVSFTSPENITQVGNGIFTDCPELAAVRWNTTTKLPDNSFDANHNPNLLLFVRFEIASPSHTAVANQIINGTAQSIVLVDDYASNFYCPEQFYAKSIKYTHKFTMTSGNGGGWESFALPFTPTRFIHESKGELLPFMSYEQQENKEAYRPFWLRSLNELGFEDATTMEANKPYIICMPNNERYATRFRLAGNVTFSATDTYVPVTNPESAEKGNVMFVPNFMHRDKEAGILAINLETVDEFLPGSAFLENVRGLRPFEAYARSIGVSRQAIRIDDADLATAIQDTQLIDVSGNAIIKVYNLSGNLVITGKRSEVMPKLADGVYIIDGKKIAVK